MISAKSVKDRLKNKSVISGKTFQDALIAYGLERTVYRLSISEYVDRFTLKGGIFLYALFDGEFSRATRDIDLLAMNLPNSIEDIKTVFEKIFSIDCDDALQYDLCTLEVKNITEFKEYHGVNVSVIAYLDKTKVPISIDIGFGDVVYPSRVKMEFPVLLSMEAPEIYAYSISSVISEKFEAIVSLGDANSRYKDFYDIYFLADSYNLDGTELKEAIKATFEHRKTGFSDIFAFTDDFITSEIHQRRWHAFTKKKKTLLNVELLEVIDVIKAVLLPIVESIRDNKEYRLKWNHQIRAWQ
nr:nucleotidyl transferase AbiEii/AbiGii toxin family protein [uncultured Mogibacterium sp.]